MESANTITPLQAVKRMRELTAAGVPFSFSFYSYNETKGLSHGLKRVQSALLRQGLRNDQSHKANVLIAYNDHSKGDNARFFHLPLLMMFNDYIVKP